MKAITLLSLTSGIAASAIPLMDWQSAPQGQRILPRLDKSEPIDGAKRKEVLYGPYTVPPGEMIKSGNANGESPCTNCYVTAMQATIKYPNGTEALTTEGAWLHHTVLSNPRSSSSQYRGPIWAAGNERPTIRLNTDGMRYGIDFPPRLSYSVDIMSERPEPFTVSMSITYEYIEKDSEMGKKYRASKMHWSQIGYPPPPNGKASFKTPQWVADVDGRLLYAIGHMHDGGTHQQLLVNGKLVCNSTMFYGQREGYGSFSALSSPSPNFEPDLIKPPISPPDVSEFSDEEEESGFWFAPSSWFEKRSAAPQHTPDHGSKSAFGGAHISDPGACTNFASIKKGDIITSEAFYDLQLHPTMSHDGKPERLMGNMRIYIGPD